MFPSVSLALIALPLVSAAVHHVQVGAAGKLLYDPEAIAASPGDQVVFHFHAVNHTATQSTFADPCGWKDGGFDSGFQPVAANQTDNLPTYTITVPDDQPIWMHCAQASNTPKSHCGAGMVFAVNCGADGAPNSFTNFKKAALAVGDSLKAAATSATDTPAAYTTAAYGGYTIPPAPVGTPVTQVVAVGQSTWTTSYTSYPGSPAPTPVSLGGAVHVVVVGGPGKLAFDPPSVQAAPRDTIVFEFHQKNHSVSQSSFDDPCRPLNKNGVLGFDSGFMPVADDATEFPTWNYTVTGTEPVWGFCRQPNPSSHCGAGMVFAINPVETSARNFAAYQNVAKALNGTAAAVNNPSPTPIDNGASSLTMGGFGVSVIIAVMISLF